MSTPRSSRSGPSAGQVAGGVVVDADLLGAGWRPVFLVNVPVALVLLAVGRRVLPRGGGLPGHSAANARANAGAVRERAAGAWARGGARRMDWPGLVLLGAAVSLVTVPLVLGRGGGRALVVLVVPGRRGPRVPAVLRPPSPVSPCAAATR